MRYLLATICAWLILAVPGDLLIYLAGAFAGWDFNPLRWNTFTRGIAAFLMLCWTAGTALSVALPD